MTDTNIEIKDNDNVVVSSFLLTRMGLSPIGDPTFEQWKNAGKFVKFSSNAIHFWVGDWLNYGEAKFQDQMMAIIDELGYDIDTINRDKYVSAQVLPSLRKDNLSFEHHKLIAPMNPDEQKELLDEAAETNMPLDDFREKVKVKKATKEKVVRDTFDVIYADPDYNKDGYLPIQKVDVPSSDNAVVFIWTNAELLMHTYEIMFAWGFRYITHMIWDKEAGTADEWFLQRHELLLVGVKGDYASPAGIKFESVKRTKGLDVSEKPMEIIDMIEELCPNAKYLNVFGDLDRKGWTSVGE